MILNGLRLLLFPSRSRSLLQTSGFESASWLIATALTAAVWPALAVVLGHIGSALIGNEETQVAVLRAVVGFTAVLGGALVTAPALALLVMLITEAAQEHVGMSSAISVAMGIIWPAWAGGVVLIIPPMIGLGPELGEIMWLLIAAVAAIRVIRTHVIHLLGVRRRWVRRFEIQLTGAFVILFALVVIAPPMTARSILGAASPAVFTVSEKFELPLPPEPRW